MNKKLIAARKAYWAACARKDKALTELNDATTAETRAWREWAREEDLARDLFLRIGAKR